MLWTYINTHTHTTHTDRHKDTHTDTQTHTETHTHVRIYHQASMHAYIYNITKNFHICIYCVAGGSLTRPAVFAGTPVSAPTHTPLRQATSVEIRLPPQSRPGQSRRFTLTRVTLTITSKMTSLCWKCLLLWGWMLPRAPSVFQALTPLWEQLALSVAGGIPSQTMVRHFLLWPLFITWASYQIRKIACCACAGNVFPVTDFKGNVS